MKILTQNLKKYFTEKSTNDFWKHAFITLFLFRYVAPTMLIFVVMLQLGLVTPDIDPSVFNETQQTVAESMANAYVGGMFMVHGAGQSIGQSNPIIARIIFHGLSAFVWGIYGSMIFVVLQISRYIISHIYRKVKRKRKK